MVCKDPYTAYEICFRVRVDLKSSIRGNLWRVSCVTQHYFGEGFVENQLFEAISIHPSNEYHRRGMFTPDYVSVTVTLYR